MVKKEAWPNAHTPLLSSFAFLLPQIRLESQNETDENNIWSQMTVDGVDFLIEEPSNFSSEWYSHKFDGPGV